MSIAEQPIPIYTTLADVYGTLEASLQHATRWNNLAEEFEKRFGRRPVYIARAPGRVNLIGEHIDYALFGVLPAAVEPDILIACGPRPVVPQEQTKQPSKQENVIENTPGSVVAENLHPKYPRQVFVPALKVPLEQVSDRDAHAEYWSLDINTKELRWESYVKAGYYGVLNNYFSSVGSGNPIPVDLLVNGTVPAGSGLSSSAAMVVASTLSFLAVNGKLESGEKNNTVLNMGDLVRMAMENEKRVGVNSGGMDQAASVMSDPSCALYITFYPSLHASRIPLPNNAVFVIANSLVVADKALTAKRGYNLRVVETLVGARIVANYVGLGNQFGPKDRITYREVLGKFAGEKEDEELSPLALENDLTTLERRLMILQPKEKQANGEMGVTMDEMVEMSGLSKEVFEEVYLSWVDIEATRFQLYKRAKHVFSEARRVLQFRRTCLEAAESEDPDDNFYIEYLGRVMNESQQSCAAFFECSCPELDELTRLARQAGACGSRLTGAGWGGCTVSLVEEDQVDQFIQKMQQTYKPYRNLQGDALKEAIFATKPGNGACVFKMDN